MQVVGARGADPHPRAAQAAQHLGDVGVGDQPAAPMTTTRSAIELHLAHQVAGDQDRAALVGEAAQQRPDPAHAVEVEAVDRLVEEQHLRVAEQRGGDAEPLPHAERVALDPSAGRLREAHLVETSSTRDGGMPLVWAAIRRWARPVRPGCIAPASSSAPTSRSGAASVGVRPAVDGGRAGRRSVEAHDHPHGGRLAGAVGPEEAGDLPGSTSNVRSSTARTLAVPLVSPRALIMRTTLGEHRRRWGGGAVKVRWRSA